MKKLTCVLLLLSMQIFGAGFTRHKETGMQRIIAAYSTLTGYHATQAEKYTLRGMEAYAGRKLTREEKMVFRLMSKGHGMNMAATDEADQAKKIKNTRTLAIFSLVAVGAGVITVFLLPILGLSLLAAGTICGFVAKGNAKRLKDENAQNLGNIAGIAGVAGIVAFSMIVLIGVLVFIAFLSAL